MSDKVDIKAVVIAVLMVLSVLLMVPGEVAATNDPGPGYWTIIGDWVVDADKTYENVSINATGNIFIVANLTLRNVTLNMVPGSPGNTGIRVFDGGGLYIYDLDDDNTTTGDASVIRSDDGNNYLWIVDDGADLEIKNSEVHDCGVYPGTYNPILAGLFVAAADAHIEKTLFVNTVAGVQLWDTAEDSFIAGNTVVADTNLIGMVFFGANNTLVENNTIYNSFIGIAAFVTDGLDLVNNSLITSVVGLAIDDAINLMVTQNTITGNAVVGMQLNDTHDSDLMFNTFDDNIGYTGVEMTNTTGNYFEGNTFDDNLGIGLIMGESSNNDFFDNTFMGNGVGINLVSGADLITFEEDTVANNGEFGVLVMDGMDNLMENCTVGGHTTTDVGVNTTGTMTLLNTTFDDTKTLVETGGELTVMWYVNVNVTDVLGDPMGAVAVSVKDASDTTIDTGVTNANGYVKWIPAIQFIEDDTTRDSSMNNHTVYADDGTTTLNESVDVDHTMTIGFEFNYGPTSTLPAELDFEEDTHLEMALNESFDDLDDIIFSYTGGDNIQVDLDGGTGLVNFTAPENWNGQEHFNFTATDTKGLKKTMETLVIVTSVPDAPVISDTVPDKTVDEDAGSWEVNLTSFESDVDLPDDVLTWEVSDVDTSLLTVTVDGSILNFTLVANASGEDVITLTLKDNTVPALVDSQNITVTVNPVNDAPEITTTPVLTAEVGTDYTYDVDATDIDDEEPTYSLEGPPTGMEINGTSGEISWAPDDGQEGDQTIIVKVSDGDLSVTQEYVLVVDPRPNDPPEITSMPVKEARAGEGYEYKVLATDIQNDPLTYELDDAPTGMTINETSGVITWTPTEAQVDEFTVVVKVSDPYVHTLQEFNVTVSPSILPDITITSHSTGNKVKNKVTLSGAITKGTYDITKVEIQVGDGAWEELDGTSSWTYQLNTKKLKNGEETITVRVTDSEGKVDTATITVKVDNEKEGPGLGGDMTTLFILLAIIITVVVIVIAVAMSRKKKVAPPPPGGDPYGQAQMPESGAPTTEAPIQEAPPPEVTPPLEPTEPGTPTPPAGEGYTPPPEPPAGGEAPPAPPPPAPQAPPPEAPQAPPQTPPPQ